MGDFSSFPLRGEGGRLVTPRSGRGSCSFFWAGSPNVTPQGGDGYGLPAGEVGFGYSPLGERVGLHDYSSLGRGWVKWLWSSHWGTWFMGKPHWGRGWVACLFPTGGEGGRNGYCLPAGEVGFGYSPLGERVELHDYSSLGERVGKMVMVFPLGNLVYGYSPLGERVGCMLIPHWGRGWAKWLLSSCWGSWFWLLPAGGEGGVA